MAPGSQSQLDRQLLELERSRPEQSGFLLLDDGPEAFALRWRTAELAGRSLDLQTYIWHGDTTGLALASALLDAADRGVRVRILVDDLDARAKSAGLAALQAHANIDVRLFNPFGSRRGFLRLVAEAVGSFDRINRRMHNKSWIADNRVAIVGGRNLGDEYFGASGRVNFEDLDFLMLGPVVRDASASFDRFWNSPVTYPIDALEPKAIGAENLAALRSALTRAMTQASEGTYAEAMRSREWFAGVFAEEPVLHWSANYQFVSDLPEKAMRDPDPANSQVAAALLAEMQRARSSIYAISPYFVPGRQGTALLSGFSSQDIDVEVLTNSLAANDVAAVHGGYAARRRQLLEGGVELWEIKPTGGTQAESGFVGSSGASLHTKALVIDSRTVFVGSYNMDPRSTSLNCEQGVLVQKAAVGAQLEALFRKQTSADRAWRVTLEQGHLVWSDGDSRHGRDPWASPLRRLQAWLARVLGFESQL